MARGWTVQITRKLARRRKRWLLLKPAREVVRDVNTTRPVRVMPVTLCRLPPAQTHVTTRPRRIEVKVGEKKLLPTRTIAAAARGSAAPAPSARLTTGVVTPASSNAATTATMPPPCFHDLELAIRAPQHKPHPSHSALSRTVTGMDHLAIPVRDREHSRRFYETYFGFGARPARRYDDGVLMLYNAAGFALALGPSEEQIVPPSWMHFGIGLPNRDAVLALRDRLAADGVELVEEWDEAEYVSVKCRDPDGYIVEAAWEPQR